MGEIAQRVNNKLSGTYKNMSTTVYNTITTSNPEDYIWTYLKGKQFNDYAISAIMGNMYAESGFIANNLENTAEKRFGLTDSEYTTAVDNGTYKNFASDNAGYGLCQWTYSLGKQRLLDFSKKIKKSVGDLYTQMEFFYWDITTNFKTLKANLDNSKSVAEATKYFLTTYEYGGTPPDALLKQRTTYATQIYNKHATSAKTITTQQDTKETRRVPYTVKVEVGELRIRAWPSTESTIKGSIKDKSVYTIIQESQGNGAKLWGKLKSGAGWIALDYCKFVKNV